MTEDFNSCYEKYYPVILKHAAYLTGNIQAAEDIAQETFIKLHKIPPSHTNIGAWLMKIATNLSYNYMRADRVKRAKMPVLAEHEMSNVISIEDAAIKDLEIRLIRKALYCLKPRDRLCLLLKYSGYKYSEIAETAGIDVNSVGKVLARAQDKLKKTYLKEASLK
jgi:RNA polymerase sigma factor (sigma-70 family)